MTAASSNFSTLLSSMNCLLTSETLVPCLWCLHPQFSFSNYWCSAASACFLLFSGSHWHLSDTVVLLLFVALQTLGPFTGSFPFSAHNPYFIVILWSRSIVHYIHSCIAHVWNNSLNVNDEFRILKSKLFLSLILLNFAFFHFNTFFRKKYDCNFRKTDILVQLPFNYSNYSIDLNLPIFKHPLGIINSIVMIYIHI